MPPELAVAYAEAAQRRAVPRAGDTPLTTRSLEPVTACVAAAILAAPAYLAAVNYLDWLNLWVADAYLVTLLGVMACDVTGGVLLALKRGKFRWSALAWGHAKKLVELMVVAIAFTLQAARPDGYAWGSYMMLGVVVYELNSFRRIAAGFGLKLPALDQLIAQFSRPTTGIAKELHHEQIAKRERARTVRTLADSGIITRDEAKAASRTVLPGDVKPAPNDSALYDSFE